uniref:Uncharacterized protein n=1 Tax=viral metagenome TaxID=1070528 RepID=A0A6M3J9W5_9ZZZZ
MGKCKNNGKKCDGADNTCLYFGGLTRMDGKLNKDCEDYTDMESR